MQNHALSRYYGKRVFLPEYRLTAKRDYQKVFQQGKRKRGVFFTFIISFNQQAFARLGLAVAKRCVPLAVKRNYIRRIIRESFRGYHPLLEGVDVVVVMQKSPQAVSSRVLRDELDKKWKQLITSLKKAY